MDKNRPITTSQVEASAKRWALGLGLLLIIAAAGLLIYKLVTNPKESTAAVNASACALAGGVFDAEHNECSDVSETKCRLMGGEFVDCGNPCRHSRRGPIEVCPAVCDDYCKL